VLSGGKAPSSILITRDALMRGQPGMDTNGVGRVGKPAIMHAECGKIPEFEGG
jgi:hypothetical protein